MRAYLALGPLSLILLTSAVAPPKSPSFEGTYRLISRDLANGTKQMPPNIVGMITFTKHSRNFNVYWKDAGGKAMSISAISTYQLTNQQYRETNVYYLVNDEISGKGVSYDLSSSSAASPVTIKGNRIEVQFPLHDEPRITFEGNKMTATRAGAFVDHWERVQ